MGWFYNRKSCAVAALFQSNSQTPVQFSPRDCTQVSIQLLSRFSNPASLPCWSASPHRSAWTAKSISTCYWGPGADRGVTTAPHIRWNKRSPGPTGRLYLCITCSLACHSSVCLHNTQCVHTLLPHGTDHVTEVIASVWPKATQCTGQENMKGLKTVGQDHASRGSTRPCFATDQASGRGGPVCGNCSFLDHLDPAYPSLPCKCPTNCPQVTLIHRPSSPQRWVNL